jgi:tetratricopeptide (TPR) repeat protein
VGWHRREAAACLDAGLWSSALVHLVPLVEAEPEDPMWREQRAHAHGSLGDYARAAADYAALRVVAGGLDRYPFLRHALALLGANDAAGAREIVRAAVERFRDTGDALQANMTAWLCGVMPGAVSDYGVPVALARRATAAQPQNGAYRNTLAAVLYRAGELDEARGHFEAAIAIENRIDIPTDWAFLAMIHARQGRAGEARRALENARSALVEFERRDAARSPSQRYHWHQWLEARLLTAEAEAVAGK